MTPFELGLESELNVEWQRFVNDWLFKWHGMKYEGGLTDVDDFRGGRIQYSAIEFGYQQQQVFWQAIHRYLILKVHESFRRWDSETQSYPTRIRKSSIDGVERSLRQFVVKIIHHSLDTDRRLRGMGHPENVAPFDASGQASTGGAEIVRLAQAHRALLDERIKKEEPQPAPFSILRCIEAFYTNHKGLIWLGGLIVAAIGTAWRFFVG